MQDKSKQQLFNIVCQLSSGKTKTIQVKASDFATARRRAMKRVPSAISCRKANLDDV